MTDYWKRPGASGEPEFEIPLVGADGHIEYFGGGASSDDGAGGGEPPNWRKVAGLSALAGIAISVAAAILVVASSGGDDPQTEATAPLETVAPFVTEAPSITQEPRRPRIVPPVPLSLPDFPVVPETPAQDLGSYDLASAVAANVPGDLPRRSMFSVTSSDPNARWPVDQSKGILYTTRAIAANEPAAGLDSFTIQFGGSATHMVVDRGAQAIFKSGDNGVWRAVDAQSVTEGTGSNSVDGLLDAFVAGPITPAAIEHARIAPYDAVVRLAGGAFARRYDVEVPIADLQPYGALVLANITSATVAAAAVPDAITFQVYVTDQPRLALVTSRFHVDDRDYVLSQFFDRQPADVRIELPAAVNVA